MHKVCFVVPYFGTFPSTFPLWLECCRKNPSFTWLLITDNLSNYNYPTNVKVYQTSLTEIKKRFEKKLGFETALKKPYKLCDFKPLYGDLLSTELKGYTHWGYCDIDLLFGNLKDFITDERLSEYDKISVLGHMSVLKNNDEINQCYKKCNYKGILQDSRNKIFDEIRHNININSLLSCSGYKVLEKLEYADIVHDHYKFMISTYNGGKRCVKVRYMPTIFRYINGNIEQLSLDENGKIKIRRVAYVHFQKREIEFDGIVKYSYLLVPNKITKCVPITVGVIKKFSHDNFMYVLKKKKERIIRAIKIRIKQ